MLRQQTEQQTNEYQKVKNKNSKFFQILSVILIILLLLGTIGFVVFKGDSKVENGLSAYELAVKYGYEGTVQEWLDSLSGKSAYDIAVDNGYSGTEKEWTSALEASSKQDGASIKTASFSSDGELLITLSDNSVLNLGKAIGADGKNGANGKDGTNGINGINGKDGVNGSNGKDGKNGTNGKNGVDGKDGANGLNGADGINGTNGKDGKDGTGIVNVTISAEGALSVELSNGTVLNLGNIKGADGIGVSKSEINSNGELILTYTSGETAKLGVVVGAKGADGTDGADGKDGIGIKTVTLSADGELSILLTDNTVLNLGNVKGEKGDTGEKGEKGDKGADGKDGVDGKDGRGIADMAIINGEIVITYTDGTKSVIGKSDDVILNESDTLEFTLLSDGTYAVTGCLVDNPTEITIPSKFNGKFVTKIYSNAFENIITLKTVNIPNSILSIGTRAFYGCNTLKNVNISTDSELQEIAGYAFYGCSALTDIYFPTYVDYIGAYAFYQSGLTTAVFECPTNWNLFGKWNNGYPAHLSPTDSANAAKALSTNYTSHTSSDFYKNAWIRNDSYSNGSIVGTYEREL